MGKAAKWGAGKLKNLAGKAMPKLKTAVQEGAGKFTGKVNKAFGSFKNRSGKATDFYVTPSGDVVPATGYKYISENAAYLDDMTKTMSIPANIDGTYFSFDNYDIANPEALQVPYDASVKISFDTLQIIDDISVPYGNWGKTPYLEPIITDFPNSA